ILGEDVPRTELEVVQRRERKEVADARGVMIGALAEANGAELGERPDRLGQPFSRQEDAGDHRGGNGAEARKKDGEFSRGRRDLMRLAHARVRSKSAATSMQNVPHTFCIQRKCSVFELVHFPLAQSDPSRGPLAAAIGREFPSIHRAFDHDGLPGPYLHASEWESPRFDGWRFDGEIDGAEALHLIDDRGRGAGFVVEVLNRCQRAIDRRNQHSQCAAFERALRAHRELHDLTKPLVLADYRHALDVWQWTLRLEPNAS